MSGYMQHGRRHGPNGSDPILGLGGGTTAHEGLNGASSPTVANGAAGTLDWSHTLGDTLLDLSDPFGPTVVADGVYSVTVTAHPGADMTVGGSWQLELSFDVDLGLPDVILQGYVTAAIRRPYVSCSMAWYLPAGTAIYAYALNSDSVSSRPFGIYAALVQKIS